MISNRILCRTSIAFAVALTVSSSLSANSTLTGRIVSGSIPADATGIWDNHGDDPNNFFNEQPLNSTFRPEYITLVWIDNSGPWTLTTVNASFKITQATDARAFAIDAFKKLDRLAAKHRKFENIAGNLNIPIHTRNIGNHKNKKDVFNFDEFGFASQGHVFFYIANKHAKLMKRELYTNTGAPTGIVLPQLINFSPYDSRGKPVSTNKSFYASGIEDISGLDGPIIWVRNHYRNPTGGPMAASDTFEYSMNIFFELADNTGSGLKHIPIVLDPTTGNGQGYEP